MMLSLPSCRIGLKVPGTLATLQRDNVAWHLACPDRLGILTFNKVRWIILYTPRTKDSLTTTSLSVQRLPLKTQVLRPSLKVSGNINEDFTSDASDPSQSTPSSSSGKIKIRSL